MRHREPIGVRGHADQLAETRTEDEVAPQELARLKSRQFPDQEN